MSNKATVGFSSVFCTSVSLLCLILLCASMIRNESRHSDLESRVILVETSLDALRTKLAAIFAKEDLTKGNKGKNFFS